MTGICLLINKALKANDSETINMFQDTTSYGESCKPNTKTKWNNVSPNYQDAEKKTLCLII